MIDLAERNNYDSPVEPVLTSRPHSPSAHEHCILPFQSLHGCPDSSIRRRIVEASAPSDQFPNVEGADEQGWFEE